MKDKLKNKMMNKRMFGLIANRKFYKLVSVYTIDMLPSDPSGSLDESYYSNYCFNLGGVSNG